MFTSQLLDVMFQTVATIFVYMTLWFCVSLIIKRNDFVDVAWGLGFIVVGIVLNLSFPSGLHAAILLLLISLWGIRLSAHIFERNLGKKEDFRYKNWRDSWGKWFYVRSYLQVYLLQGFFMFLISLPTMVSVLSDRNVFGFLEIFGIGIWIIGFTFESLGDYQLKKFIKEKKLLL